MLTIIRHFRLAIRTVISDYVLDILRGANIKEGTDKYLSSILQIQLEITL